MFCDQPYAEDESPLEPSVGFLVRTGARDIAITFPDGRESAIDRYWRRTIAREFSVVRLGGVDRGVQGFGVDFVVDGSGEFGPHGYWTKASGYLRGRYLEYSHIAVWFRRRVFVGIGYVFERD